MKRTLLLITGVAGFLIGLGFVMPAVALWRSGTQDTVMIFGPLALGVALMAGAVFAASKGLARPRL